MATGTAAAPTREDFAALLEETFGGGRGRLSIDATIPEALVKLLCESETSGGLLFAVDAARTGEVRDGFARRGEPVWEIGLVTAESRLAVL